MPNPGPDVYFHPSQTQEPAPMMHRVSGSHFRFLLGGWL